MENREGRRDLGAVLLNNPVEFPGCNEIVLGVSTRIVDPWMHTQFPDNVGRSAKWTGQQRLDNAWRERPGLSNTKGAQNREVWLRKECP